MILEAIANSLKESYPTLDIRMLEDGRLLPLREKEEDPHSSICIDWPSHHHRPIVHLATISLIGTTIVFIASYQVPPTFNHYGGKHRYDISDPNSILIIERLIADLVKNATRIEKALDGLSGVTKNVSSP